MLSSPALSLRPLWRLSGGNSLGSRFFRRGLFIQAVDYAFCKFTNRDRRGWPPCPRRQEAGPLCSAAPLPPSFKVNHVMHVGSSYSLGRACELRGNRHAKQAKRICTGPGDGR